MKISLVIPAYNEEKRIRKALDSYVEFLGGKRLNDSDLELLIVVNNSSDRTAEIVRQYSAKYSSIKCFEIPYYTGKGGAVAIGMLKAEGDLIGFVDADGSSSPSEIMKAVNKLAQRPWLDGVIASRYISGGEILGEYPFTRWFTSRAFNLVTKVVFGLNYFDTQCGLKIFRRAVARELAEKVAVVGWAFDLNMLLVAKKLGFKIEESATIWRDSEGSKVNFKKTVKELARDLPLLKSLEISDFINNSLKMSINKSLLSVRR